jgi:hypothetical protein
VRKWLIVGALALLALWGPYLYAELTHAPVETKDTPHAEDLADDDPFADVEPGEIEPEPEEVEPEEPELAEDEELEDEEPAEELALAEEVEDPSAEAEEFAEGEDGDEDEDEDEEEGDEEGDPDEEEVPSMPLATALAPMIGAGVHALPTLIEAYENETRDSLWAGDAERRLLGMLGAADMPANIIESMHCQKTVCRIEMSWNQEFLESYVKAHQSMRETFGTDIGVTPLEAGSDAETEHLAVYVPREGYTLADLKQ